MKVYLEKKKKKLFGANFTWKQDFGHLNGNFFAQPGDKQGFVIAVKFLSYVKF